MEYFFSLFSLSKSGTNSALNWSELALLVFGLVLSLGLVGEYKTLEPHSRRMKLFEMFVIIGVLGELFGDGGIFLFSHQQQAIADQEISGLIAENTAAKKELEATFMRTRPRMVDNQKFQETLKGKPKADVEILFTPGDEEAYSLAIQIKGRLTDKRPGMGAGWTVLTVRPLTKADTLPGELNRPDVPLATKAGAWWGLGFVVRSAPYPMFSHENDCPVCALQMALLASLFPPSGSGGQITFDPRMPDNIIKIVIGQKQSGM